MDLTEIDHLRTFLAVAKREGISRATAELHLTQSAISRQIQNLERSLGVQLFLRKGRSVELTEAGRVLHEYATRTVQLLAEAREAIDNVKGLVRGQLRISAASTIGTYILPGVLGAFKARYPGIEISLVITNKEQVLRHLMEGSADLGFVAPPIPPGALATEEYVEDDLVLIVSPAHRLARRRVVRARDLAEEVFVLREKGSGTREIMEEELQRAGVRMHQMMDLGSTEAVKRAVTANLGVSIVSTHVVTQEVRLAQLCTARIADLNLRRRIYLVYPRKFPLSLAAQGFRRFLLESLAAGRGRAGGGRIATRPRRARGASPRPSRRRRR